MKGKDIKAAADRRDDRSITSVRKAAKKAERLDPSFAVFNQHVNKADERAMALLEEFSPAYAAEIKKAEDKGIMSIFSKAPTPATSAYAWLVTAFVNEGK